MVRILTVILILFGNYVFSQDYKVKFSTDGFYSETNYSVEYVRLRIVSQFDNLPIDGNGEVAINGKPFKISVRSHTLDVDEYGDIVTECGPATQEIFLSFSDCHEYSNLTFLTTCLGPVSIQVEIAPILTFGAGTIPENNAANSTPYCISEPIRIVAQSGFSSYRWEYRVLGENWKSFNPGSGNDVSFTLKNALGSQANNYLNKTIFFRYNVGNCSSSTLSDPLQYVFTIPPPNVESVAIQHPTCFNGGNGSISVVGLDRALLPEDNILYSLNDNNGVQLYQNGTGLFNGLSSGDYSVSVQPISSAYCSLPLGSKQAKILNPTRIIINVANSIPASCFGSSSGAVSINPSGGSGSGYQFSIDGGGFNGISTFSSLSPGNHMISVKDSKGCLESRSITVSGPASTLDAFITITSDFNGNSLSCSSSIDASVDISATGGWGGFTYSKSQNGNYSTSSTFGNLNAGFKTFWIKDSKGCIISRNILISAPQKLVITSVSINQPFCSGDYGSISTSAMGGTGTIQYSVNNVDFQSSPDFNLLHGNHIVYAKDINGCLASSSSFSIINPPEINFSISKADITCRNTTDGSIIFQDLINGNAPYQYSIDGGANYYSSATFFNNSSGDYIVVVKDSKGCISSSIITIGEPFPIQGSIAVSEILCSGESNGSLTVTGSGGAGGYNYLWSNGSTNNTINNLTSGVYSLVITDQGGCTSEVISTTIINPEPILITPIYLNMNGNNVSCNGNEDGQVDLAISGGSISSDYQYEWSNGHTGNSLVDVSAGVYQVIITDDNGCNASESIVITEPEILEFNNINVQNVTCNGGSDGQVIVLAKGGVGGYLYSLNGSDLGTNNVFDNLISGDYDLEVKDLNGCKKITTISITEPAMLSLQEKALVSTLCGQANGSIDISVSGGLLPYTFEWTDFTNNVVSNNEDLFGVKGGTYKLLITDGKGCTLSFTRSIPNSDGPNIQVDLIVGTSCIDSDDGKAIISVTGGMPPYEVKWDNGESGKEAKNLLKGNVEVSVKDYAGCISFLNIYIPGSSSIELDEVRITRPTCFNGNNGSVEIIASGGVSPLSYFWSNGNIGASVGMLTAGVLDLIISDANGCQIEETISIGQPEQLEIEIVTYSPTCGNEEDGRAILEISGGTEPYQIILEGNDQSTSVLDKMEPGTYSVEIIDSNLCSIVSAITIPEPEQWILDFEDITICEGQEISLTQPDGAVEMEWYLNNELISVNNRLVISKPGEYSLVATDSMGCLGQGSFVVITSNEILNADFLMSSTAVVADTIIVIDISWPIPDSASWIAPLGVEILESTNDYAIFIISETGVYTVGFESFLGLCQDYYSSTIEIFDSLEPPLSARISGEMSPMIISMEMYPNPTDGIFKVDCVIREENSARIKIVSLTNNQILFNEESPSNFTHSFNFELPDLAVGSYALVFEAAGEIKILRMIKQ